MSKRWLSISCEVAFYPDEEGGTLETQMWSVSPTSLALTTNRTQLLLSIASRHHCRVELRTKIVPPALVASPTLEPGCHLVAKVLVISRNINALRPSPVDWSQPSHDAFRPSRSLLPRPLEASQAPSCICGTQGSISEVQKPCQSIFNLA